MTEQRPPWHDYPQVGPPGFTQQINGSEHILFLRSDAGELLGLVFFYADAAPRGARAGEVVLRTSPWHLRKGIMSRMLDEACRRWPIELHRQHYNEGGTKFIQKYLERRNLKLHDVVERTNENTSQRSPVAISTGCTQKN